MTDLIHILTDFFSSLGYTGVFFMMVLESSFFPFPSEVAMIPAGYLASIGEANIYLMFLAGAFGAMTGAFINYFLGFFLGKKVILFLIQKYGKYVFIKKSDYDKTEKFFIGNGSKATFLGRLIPVIRQLISIPAGIFKMDLLKFTIFTIAGASLWNIILLSIGYFFGENKDLIIKTIHKYSKEFLLVLIILFIIIFFIHIYKRKNANK